MRSSTHSKYRFVRHLTAGLVLSQSAFAENCAEQHWVAAWQSAASDASRSEFDTSIFFSPANALIRIFSGEEQHIKYPIGSAQNYRVPISSLGSGKTLRFRFSNRLSSSPLVINSVQLARQTTGPAIDASSLQEIKFGGAQSIVIPPGREFYSDPVDYEVHHFDRLTVSIYVGPVEKDFVPTQHAKGGGYTYVSNPGSTDLTKELDGSSYQHRTIRRPILSGMDVLTTKNNSSIVAIGDSLTDGSQAPGNHFLEGQRYTDHLQRRIIDAKLSFFTANVGIAGNRVMTSGSKFLLPQTGPSAMSRYAHDVLNQAGVSDVILFQGINDVATAFISTHVEYKTALNSLLAGYEFMIKDMQSRGLRVMQGTLTPAGNVKGLPGQLYSGLLAKKMRQDINRWIRLHSPADTVIDFDAAVRDSKNPDSIDKRYDAGDGLHLNSTGYAKMASIIPLERLKGSACSKQEIIPRPQ